MELPPKSFTRYTETERLGNLDLVLNAWIPPFTLLNDRIFSFHDLASTANPLHTFVEHDETETLDISTFASGEEGSRRFVWLLNLCFEEHLYRRGLLVDKKESERIFHVPKRPALSL